jgi:hypothetical protein
VLLERFVVDALAMATKAGQVISGFTKVADALERPNSGEVRALIHATGGAADGIRKLDAIVSQNGRNNGPSAEVRIVNVLTSEQLDLALGRSNVIHAALLAGPASDTFLSRSQMLVRYRMADEDGTVAVDKNSPI